jgi:C4-dicarboxylate-specific signal transduction histidine kinase
LGKKVNVIAVNEDLIWSFSPTNFEIQWVNGVCHNRLGMQPGRDCRSYFLSDQSLIETVFESVEKDRHWEGILSFKEPDHELPLPLFSKVFCIEDAGQPLILCTSMDLQRRQKMESSLIQQTKLASIGRMTSDVAHEITNPLSIIMGRVEELQRKSKIGQVTPESLDQDLTKILRNCTRIHRITKALRTFSRDGGSDPKTKVFLSQLIDEALELCLDRLSQRGIELIRNVEPHLFVEVRPSEIEQVIVNLVMNSIDALKNISKPWVEITAAKKGEWICIQVRDNGCGVMAEIANDIMKPFFTTKEAGFGTGLGLSISQTFILKHGGQFYLDPESPHTCFTIELPNLI